jgi:hypothetical protein
MSTVDQKVIHRTVFYPASSTRLAGQGICCFRRGFDADRDQPIMTRTTVYCRCTIAMGGSGSQPVPTSVKPSPSIETPSSYFGNRGITEVDPKEIRSTLRELQLA